MPLQDSHLIPLTGVKQALVHLLEYCWYWLLIHQQLFGRNHVVPLPFVKVGVYNQQRYFETC